MAALTVYIAMGYRSRHFRRDTLATITLFSSRLRGGELQRAAGRLPQYFHLPPLIAFSLRVAR